jgi:uncharacterized protein (TIGR03437 family)
VRFLVFALIAAAHAAIPQPLIPPALRFEANAGQADPRAQFVARSSRYNIFLTTTGAVLSPGVRIRFVDSNAAKLEGADALPGVVNYFRGTSQRLANITTFARVVQRNLYPGIDAVFHGEDGWLEYDFLVAPGADASRIALAFDGARSAQLNDRGEIELETAAGALTQRKPVLWQWHNGRRIPVDGRYEQRAGRQFALVIGKYDRSRPLIIDPTLVFYRSVGGSGPDQVDGLALDSQGNIVIAGQTASLDFPVAGGVQSQLSQAYAYRLDGGTALTRLNGVPDSISMLAADPKSPSTIYAGTQNGLLKSVDSGATWTTLTGGLPAGSPVYPIVIDPSNPQILYACATGLFKSSDAGATWTAINNGLPASDFQSSGPRLVLDPFDTSHILLRTCCGSYQTTDGGATWMPYSFRYDAIAFDPNNKGIVYASQPVGAIETIYKSADAGITWNPISTVGSTVFSLLVDPHNSSTLYGGLSGLFKSTDSGVTWNPVAAPSPYGLAGLASDPVKANTLYAQYYGQLFESADGGATFNQLAPNVAIQSFAVSSNGASIYLATQAANNVFVTKLDPTGKSILSSTYMGGSVSDKTTGLALDRQDNVYVTGITQSPDFPVSSGALKGESGSPGFVFKLNPAGNKLIYSATVDGAMPGSIAVDSAGDAFVTGSSQGGLTVSKNAYWTTEPTCLATGLIGCLPQADGFVFKMNPSGSSLVYATYMNHLGSAFFNIPGQPGGQTIALDSSGNAYVTGASQSVDKLNSDGSALAYTAALNVVGRSIVLDSGANAYVTGPGALIAKLDPNGAELFSKTVGDINNDSGFAIALDATGNIVIAGETYSTHFPLFSPLQGRFATYSGFLAKLDGSASNLLFSTYVGDSQGFVLSGLALDSSGRAIIAGSTLSNNSISQSSFLDAFVSEYDMSDIPNVRLDSLKNAASLEGWPIAPGEIVTIDGAGFGTVDNTQLLFDQMPATLLSVTSNRLTAIAPYALDGKNVTQAQVQSSGTLSNAMWVIVAPTSPGIYTVDGSGSGQAVALNQDGTPNSVSNPAAVGSTVTFYATGSGQTIPPGVDGVLHRSGPVAPVNPASIYIAGLYISGPQYFVGPAPGFPADVFIVQAVVPKPIYSSVPGLAQLQIAVGGVPSQSQAYPYLSSSNVYIAIK